MLVAIIAIILGVTLSKDDKPTPDPKPPGPNPGPHPPGPGPEPIPPGYNPYEINSTSIVDDQSTIRGLLVASDAEIERLQHLHPLVADGAIKADPRVIPRGANNEIIKRVSFEFGQNDFRSAYLRLGDGDKARFSAPTGLVNKPDAQWALKLDQVGFKLLEGKFGFEFNSPRDGKTYITTKDAAFVMMDKYLQLDLVLPSRRIYGLGERNREFTLTEGTYTMWATHDNHDYDDGRQGGKQTYGVHPFALVQTATAGEFLGIYFRNSEAMSPIVRYTDNDTATLSLISVGGDIETYFFFKGTAKQIIAQYQNLVGKPALPPVWTLGWHHSGFWKTLDSVQSFVGNMTAKGLPLEGLWLDKYMGHGNQFSVNATTYPNANAWAAQLKSQGIKIVSVLTASLHTDDHDQYYTGAVQSDALIKSTINPNLESGALTNRDEGVDVVYPDFFENRAKSVWQQGIEDLQRSLPFDGLYLRKNSPYGYCSGECPAPQFAGGAAKDAGANKTAGNDTKEKHGWWSGYAKQDVESTFELPFIPGENDNLDTITASLNSTHPSNNLTEFDLHSLFGHAQGKLTYEILRQSQDATFKDKLPFLLSESTFAGSGQYMSHQFENYQLGWNNIEQQISGMMNMNMFGMQSSGPSVYTFNISKEKVYPDLAARWIQFSAFNPFAKVDSQFDEVAHGHSTPIYNLKEPYLT